MTQIKNRSVTTRALEKRSKKVTLCTQCGDIHCKGFWYAPDSQFALTIDDTRDSVTYNLCPACEMQNEGSYAGVLQVAHIPENMLASVFSVIQQVVENDAAENPQRRVLEVAAETDGYILKTTSAGMVSRIGRKILDTFDGCEARSAYKKGNESLQVTHITFAIRSYFGHSLTNN